MLTPFVAVSYTHLGVKVRYMHHDIDTIERMEIIRDLRLGEFDVLVGINLLREGLDSLTSLPRKARREPTFVLVFEASWLACAPDTPPFASASLYPR